jgi:hypothetical protein
MFSSTAVKLTEKGVRGRRSISAVLSQGVLNVAAWYDIAAEVSDPVIKQ